MKSDGVHDIILVERNIYMLDYMRISEEYRYKTELHAHTKPVSLCSEITPEEIVRAYYEYGCDTLTVTNHLNPDWTPSRTDEYLSGYYDTKKAAEGTGMNVVLGVEIRFTENANDYLVYGVSFGDIEKMIRLIPYGITEFYKEIKTRENIILQAHPFRNGQERADVSLLDGIEVFNMHPNHNSRVSVARAYAKENNKIMTCGTDFHEYAHAGLSATRFKRIPSDSFELAEMIRENDFIFQIGDSIVIG